jgi:hypothetical protein
MLRAPGNGSCIQASLNTSTLIKGHLFVDNRIACTVPKECQFNKTALQELC